MCDYSCCKGKESGATEIPACLLAGKAHDLGGGAQCASSEIMSPLLEQDASFGPVMNNNFNSTT
jgi:hypothetical protein